jgi:hypothetical protein
MAAPRFDDFREITAKFDSKSTDCGSATGGHEIKKGEIIGYCRKNRNSHTVCDTCWAKWCAENAEADAIEAGFIHNCY